jgi:enoyl-CoA hydratase
MTSYEGIRTETHDRVAEVVLDRSPVNAISAGMYASLIAVFGQLSAREDVNVVILRSAHARIFSAGADIKERLDAPSIAESASEYRQRLARACYDAILDCALPTIAVVGGVALGAGAVLAACCDIRLASTAARFGLPEISAGRCGGGRHLMRLIPQGKTRLMYFTGNEIDAAEAQRIELVQAVYPVGEEVEPARALARKIAAKSPYGLRLAKRALNESESLAVSEGYAREQRYTLRLNQHPDAAEAAQALLERRDPVWQWPEVR